MENAKTSLLDNGTLWFGAGVSIAEILAGTLLAPLGMTRAIEAILLGHLLGGILFYLVGLISARTGRTAMEAVKMAFGHKGGLLFAALNVIQLIGWTAIMIYDGALSSEALLGGSHTLACFLIGGLIVLWIALGAGGLSKVNRIAVTALFVLTLVLSAIVFRGGAHPQAAAETLSFGAALEIAISMPLSWLPVVGDYTCHAADGKKATLVSTISYNLVSCWMFVIGMGAALFAGSSEVGTIMLKAGLGAAGLFIIVFSTVTTTFLDALSAGISLTAIKGVGKEKQFAILTAVIGTAAAVCYPMDNITEFLYFIGSVFAPMAGVLIGCVLIGKRDFYQEACSWRNILVWTAGFIGYRYLMTLDIPVGCTLPDVVLVMLAAALVQKRNGRGQQLEKING